MRRSAVLAFVSMTAGCQLILGIEEHELADGTGGGGGGPTGGGGEGTGGTGPKLVGEPCDAGNECVTGSCVDQVCCEGPCDDTCAACIESLTGHADGTCGFITTDADPHADCPGDACDGAVCSGTGFACAVGGVGNECMPQTCVDGVLTTFTCDDQGGCDPSPADCNGFACDPDGCLTNCGSFDGNCTSDHYCVGTACEPDLAQGVGCDRAEQCETGFCVDGVCCDTLCDTQCMQCSGVGSGTVAGTCGEEVNGFDDGCTGQRLCCNGTCFQGTCID